MRPFFLYHLTDICEKVCITIYPAAFTLNAYAAANDVLLFTGIYRRFETKIRHAPLFEVICCGEQQGGLCRAHGAIPEI